MTSAIETLKQAILDIIGELYKKCYIGPLKIVPLRTIGWDVQLGLDNDERPIHIAAELEGDDFLKYFRQEMRLRHLNDIHFYTGYKYDAFDQPYHRVPCNHNCNHTSAYEPIR